jgi:hypothetical protein
MSEIKFSNFSNEDNSGGPDLVGITTFTSPYYFVPPSGTTAQRPSGDGFAPGMLRFNTDIGRLEVWRGDHWATILGESPNLNGGARGLFGGGYGGSPAASTNVIDYIAISTLGNALDFGDLAISSGRSPTACASATRGIFAGGDSSNVLQFVTISSTGNTQDFGDMSITAQQRSGCSNSTRGLIAGSRYSDPNNSNIIDYITIASSGNTQDFGDLTSGRGAMGSFASSTRGVWAGGGISSPDAARNIIDYVTISTTGNALDFGDLLSNANDVYSSCSNSTRGLVQSINGTNTIEFITISTLGNSSDFGDLTVARIGAGACSSSTRGVFGGGAGPDYVTIDYITIATTGNAIDFGDRTISVYQIGALSNGHGGL